MISFKQIVVLLSLLLQAQSFSVQQQRLKISSSIGSTKQYRFALRMSEDALSEAEKLQAKARALKEEAAALAGTTVEEMEKQGAVAKTTDGTFYDDETPEFKSGLSDSMKDRLMREASTGLDAEKPQTNIILYISIAVAILVALGGSGTLY